MILIFCILLLKIPIGCQSKSSSFTIETYQIDSGWGFKILKNGNNFIAQNQIPVIEGNQPFQSETEASKVGELMLKKLNDLKMPSVTKKELDSLEIRYK